MLRIRHLAVCLFAAGLFSASSLAVADNKAMNMSFDQVQQAAIQGDPDAEYALGYMYYYGNGTTKDEKSAMDWIGKAAAQGQPEAIKALKLLGQSNNSDANSPNNPAPAATANNNAGNSGNNPANNAAANNNPAGMANANAQANSNSIANADTSSSVANQAAISGNAPATVINNAGANAASAAAPVDGTASAVAASSAATADQAAAASSNVHHHKRNGHHESASHENSHSYGLSQEKLLDAPSHYYTVQLLGSYRESDITQFLRRHDLKKEAGFYQTSHNNRDWYVLVYGIYHSEEQAKAAINGLPSSVRKLNPWIKPIRAVKNSIKEAESGNRSAEG